MIEFFPEYTCKTAEKTPPEPRACEYTDNQKTCRCVISRWADHAETGKYTRKSENRHWIRQGVVLGNFLTS